MLIHRKSDFLLRNDRYNIHIDLKINLGHTVTDRRTDDVTSIKVHFSIRNGNALKKKENCDMGELTDTGVF